MAKLNDLTGRQFGDLLVIERAENAISAGIETQWLCKCKCGNLTVVRYKNLINGHTSSCGCKKFRKKNETEIKPYRNGCVYNEEGLICFDYDACDKCGWNPFNKELLQRRLELRGERKAANVVT